MSEFKQHENLFKFSLYQDNEIVTERVFSADTFNPMARYSVNIKELLPSIIQRLQKLLSKRNPTYREDYGEKTIDFLSEYQNALKSYGFSTEPNKLTPPQIKSVDIHDSAGNLIKTITGVECKFCFFINNNMIVERIFYVDKYNPAIRFSTDIVNTVNDITEDIFSVIKRNDSNNIWDDFNIIKTYGFGHINFVRELTREQRDTYLRNIGDEDFVRSIKLQYRKPNTEEATTVEE
ncbi:MAG: hypothetical protein HC836_32925 [Richelia sp. RM2_1_2]|nr:hypothetical protein [Richelia sp. RM2_1_2]